MPKIVQLFPEKGAGETGTSVAVAPGELVLSVLREPLKQMLVAADDVLFDWAKQAHGDDAHQCFAYMRRLRVERDAVQTRFETLLTEPPDTPPTDRELDFDLEALSLQDDEVLEVDIAVGNMATRGRDYARDLLGELDRRARWAQDHGQFVPGLEGLQPHAVCTAFAEALRASDPPIAMRLVMLKLFERAVLPVLPRAYAALSQALEEAGIGIAEPPRSGVPTGAASASSASASAADTSGTGGASANPQTPLPPGQHPLFGSAAAQSASGPSPEAGTAASLFPGLGLGAGGFGWLPPQQASRLMSESRLAQELGELLSIQGLPQAPTPLSQRLDVVNRLFSGVRDDPMVRPELRPALDALRYPLFKAALGDDSLLTDAGHPLRRLVDDAAVLATARNSPVSELHEVLAELVQIALLRLSPTADVARKGLMGGTALPEGALSTLDLQLQQSRQQRRRRLIDRARDSARQVLADALPEGRQLAVEAEAFVENDLLPLLALADLNFGREGRAYHEAVSVGTAWVRGYCAAPLPPPEVVHLVVQLDRALAWAQYPQERRQRALETARALLQGHPEPAHAQALIAALDRPTDTHADTGTIPPADATPEVPRQDHVVEVTDDTTSDAATEEAPPMAAEAADPITPTDEARPMAMSLRRPPHQRLQVGSYAAVYDKASDQTRWLRLAQRAAAARMLVFSDFCEEITVRVHYVDFDEDVEAGRSRLL